MLYPIVSLFGEENGWF